MEKKELLKAAKFTLFSISEVLIEISSFALLNEVFHLDYWVCYLTALILSIYWKFTLNRNFTFKSAGNIPVAMLKVVLFYLIFIPTTK